MTDTRPMLSTSLADLAARIRDEHQQVASAMQAGLAHALTAGELLLAAKKQIEHGRWEAWITEQCGIHERTGQQYMRIATELPKLDPEKAKRVSLLSFREALRVIATPARTITQTITKIDAVEAAAEAEPEKFGTLAVSWHRTGRVDAPFKRLTVMRHAEAIRAEPPPLPTGRYRVGSIDPPWKHPFRTDNAPPYPPMTVEEIMALPVPDLFEKDACIWLWTTNYHLGEGIAKAVLDAWGFAPKAILTWVKTDHFGTGTWLRNVTEHCFFAARGNPVHTLTNETTALFAPAGTHSEKPDAFYAMVERLCPAPPGGYFDMFARKRRPNWVPYGDEVPKTEAAE